MDGPNPSTSSNKGGNHAPTYPSNLRSSYRPPRSPPHEDATVPSDYGFAGSGIDSAYGYDGQTAQRKRRMSYGEWDLTTGFAPHLATPGIESATSTPRTEDTDDDRGREDEFSEPYRDNPEANDSQHRARRYLGATVVDDLMGRTKKNTSKWMIPKRSIKQRGLVYLKKYVPIIRWVPQYKLSFLLGDVVAALTMASFYIPMSLSLASNLAHIPAINGLYSFAINPLIYAIFGTCPRMVVGPEAAGSLLTGQVVRDSITRGHAKDADDLLHAQIAGVIAGVAGAILMIAGVCRLGFLENVLSKPFLRGFISGVGLSVIVDQLTPELGLGKLAETNGQAHGSPMEKIIFMVSNIKSAHGLTAAVSFGSFGIIMVSREIKRRLQPRYPRVAYFPDRFIIVVLATVLCWKLRWDQKGLVILGDVHSVTGKPFPAQFPYHFSRLKHVDTALSTAFVVAMLGYFESTVAAKGLGQGSSDGIKGIKLSANQELFALGAANIIGGVFSALPAFGGYGRSKLNSSTGGKTPVSSIILSLITFFCIFALLPAFYYIPKGVLSAMISVVAVSLLEEAPHEIRFFLRIGGWTELFLIFLVFVATLLYSLDLGMALGIGFSLLRVIKHATRSRIQILGRVQGTTDQFQNAEADPDHSEFIKGCLIVKIPEPLTFANTGELRNRLDKLLSMGTILENPASPQAAEGSHNKNLIFDVHGVTSIDGAGTQVLLETMISYKSRGIRIFFCRIPSSKSRVYRHFEVSGIVEVCGGARHFVKSVDAALRMAELESVTEYYNSVQHVA